MHGKGYEERETPPDLAIGLLVHKGMEHLFLSNGDIEKAHAELVNELGRYPHLTLEDSSLARALLLGWFRVRFLPFIEEFEVLMVEKEVQALLSPKVTLQARADLVVKRKADRRNIVFNWKTSRTKSDWNRKWRYDVQSWTEALAIEDALGERVEGCIFEGFYKGSKYGGLRTTPLLYGFKNEKLWSVEKKAGYVKVPTFNEQWYPSLEEWLQFLPIEVLEEQFIRSELITKNDDVVRAWIRQVVREEEDIDYVLSTEMTDEEREVFFIQRFGEPCTWCPFKDLCGLRANMSDLVESGFMKERVDHHATGS